MPDLPLGAHNLPAEPDAYLTPRGCGAIVMDMIDALALDGVTLAGFASNGNYSQIGVAVRPDRIAPLVLAFPTARSDIRTAGCRRPLEPARPV